MIEVKNGKNRFDVNLKYILTPILTVLTMVAGVSNQGMTNFWFATPSFIVAVLTLIDQDKKENKTSKRIIIFGLILSSYVGISRILGGRLFYPSNGKELTVNQKLCFYAVDYDLNVFSKFESVESCNAKANNYEKRQGKILEKGERLKVAHTTSNNYFFEINHYASISTKYGEGSYSGDSEGGYFLMDGKVFNESNIKNSFLFALAYLMFFPFFLISPFLYYHFNFYLRDPNQNRSEIF